NTRQAKNEMRLSTLLRWLSWDIHETSKRQKRHVTFPWEMKRISFPWDRLQWSSYLGTFNPWDLPSPAYCIRFAKWSMCPIAFPILVNLNHMSIPAKSGSLQCLKLHKLLQHELNWSSKSNNSLWNCSPKCCTLAFSFSLSRSWSISTSL